MKNKNRPFAFTLIELLVVISIISMLMSILLPTLANARDSGKRIHCLSNQRNLTIAWYSYSMDSREFLCDPAPHISGNSWTRDFQGNSLTPIEERIAKIKQGVLWPYLESIEVYKCKSSQNKFLPRSYSISQTMGTNSRFFNGYDRYPQIKTPYQKMVFTDVGIKLSKSPSPFTSCIWLVFAYTPITFSYELQELHWLSRYGTSRHSGGTNLSFADLHCEYWKFGDRAQRLFKGDISEIIESDNDQDFKKMLTYYRKNNDPLIKNVSYPH